MFLSTPVFDTFPCPQFEMGSSRRESAQTSSPKDQSGLTSAATIAKIDAVAAAAREVRRVRAEALRNLKGGLRALYRTLEWTRSRPLARPYGPAAFGSIPFTVPQTAQVPGANPLKDAHAAVLAAYGFSAKKDLLAQLLALNLEVAAKIEKGEPVATPPGVPKNYPDAKNPVTEDCIKPTKANT